MPLPHCSPPRWPANIPAARFASRLRTDHPRSCRFALIGLPDDTGVRLNNGRPGARAGPDAFRAALARYGVAEPDGWDWPTVFDAGDVVPAAPRDDSRPALVAALHETHDRVTAAVRALIDAGLTPFAIGGGHDLTFPFVRAAASTFGPLDAVYLDAHLDVRAEPGSGMPFRRLIETNAVRSLHVHGLNALANAREHVAYFRAHAGIVHPPHSPAGVFPSPTATGGAFLSIDLDVLDAAHAPGVSALNPCGWTVAQAEAWALAAGRTPHVRCADIMELNPAHDDDGRTARVAAHLFLSFLRGFAERP